MRSVFGVESDHNLLAVGIAAKGPTTTASERSAGRKRVLHELQVGATAVVALGEHSEGAGDGLPENGRPVGESPEHRRADVRAEERVRFEGDNFPEAADVGESPDDAFWIL